MRSTALTFEQQYSDDSGVQYGVRLNGNGIEFEHIQTAIFPVEEIDWLITALARIKAELSTPTHPQLKE